VQAEPGVDESALATGAPRRPGGALEAQELYFGGAQAVRRISADGELSGGGDPRRGGAVAFA